MIDILKFIFAFLFLGFFPIYLALFNTKYSRSTIVVIALGYAPALIALISILSNALNAQNTVFAFILPVLIYSLLIWNLRLKKFLDFSIKLSEIGQPLLIGLLFGLAYWLIAFAPLNEEALRLNADTLWNLGLINEMKNTFLPQDPHWYTNTLFVYHYLSNAYLAGISNFTGLDILTTMNGGNLVASLSMFILVALVVGRKNVLESLLIFLIMLVFSFTDEWSVFRSFHLHMSSAAASTFFWSLPVFISTIYIWSRVDKYRNSLSLPSIAVISFLSVSVLVFAKGTFIPVIVFLEFLSAVKMFFKERLWRLSNARRNYKQLLSFLFYPFFAILFIALFSASSNAPVFFGIEIRDFAYFKSWNPLFPLLALYFITFGFVMIGIFRRSSMEWTYLICSFFNLLLFFVLTHEGYSDIYFAFNAILLNIFFIIYSPQENKLANFLLSLLACAVFVLTIAAVKPIPGFTTFEISFDPVLNNRGYNDSISRDEVQEYIKLSQHLPKNALLAAPQQEQAKYFLFTAFLGRRIWNECPIYTTTVMNWYLPHRLFLTEQKFIPDYIDFTKPPDNIFKDESFSLFKNNLVIDSSIYENPADRYKKYEMCVFNDIGQNEFDQIVTEMGWTHVIVKLSDMPRINQRMRSLNKIEGRYIVIFQI